MLNIQDVTNAIRHYRRNKSFIKKLTRTDHPAIGATEAYLNSLPDRGNNLFSNQNLFTLNRFFVLDHPVKPGHAAYKAWVSINYQNFSGLNEVKATQLLRNNPERMQEFFQVLAQAYSETNLTEDVFIALCKLCVEGMLSQDYVNAIKRSQQANCLAESLITLKDSGSLTAENQNFIVAYSELPNLPVTPLFLLTPMLIALDKAGLNTCPNREILGNFSHPFPLHGALRCIEKIGLLTQENFNFISAENNLFWLLALKEMPEELITVDVWEGLVGLSKTSNETNFSKDIKDYARSLEKRRLKAEGTEKDTLASGRSMETQGSRLGIFFETPPNVTLSLEACQTLAFSLP